MFPLVLQIRLLKMAEGQWDGRAVGAEEGSGVRISNSRQDFKPSTNRRIYLIPGPRL